MPSLWFVVPVHGRLALAEICLRQLHRTCDALIAAGVQASAVVVSDADSLKYLAPVIDGYASLSSNGFATVTRDNDFLSRKFNDGIQLACDPKFNPEPVDYVVPCGSDDWVDHRLFLEPLPAPDTIQGFQWMSFVRENGRELCATYLNYTGGAGIRIIPRQLLEGVDYRPADEDRPRGCDTSILRNLRFVHGDRLKVKHWHLHDRQIVDWKTAGEQLNSYEQVTALRQSRVDGDPFEILAEFYPEEALREMYDHYFGIDATSFGESELILGGVARDA